jgi:hypothetical protein
MKTLLILSYFFIAFSSVYASSANLSALGQKEGSFYLSDDMNSFFNPGAIKNNANVISFSSDKFASYKEESFQVGVGRSFLDYSLVEGGFLLGEIGIEAFVGLGEEKVNLYGGTVGVSDSEYGFKVTMANDVLKDNSFFFSTSLTFPFYEMILNLKYYNMENTADDSTFEMALAKVMKMKMVTVFGDVTYDVIHGKDSLVLTAGAYTEADLFKMKHCFKASLNKSIWFEDSLKVNAGVTSELSEYLDLDLAVTFDALDNTSPKYEDFDLKAALSYYF